MTNFTTIILNIIEILTRKMVVIFDGDGPLISVCSAKKMVELFYLIDYIIYKACYPAINVCVFIF
jgi:hypothetical protein